MSAAAAQRRAAHCPTYANMLSIGLEVRDCGYLREIISGGNLGGRTALVRACGSQRLLLRVSVLPAQGSYGRHGDGMSVYGKEKVYGSIP